MEDIQTTVNEDTIEELIEDGMIENVEDVEEVKEVTEDVSDEN